MSAGSALLRRTPRQRGFTFIELMVVIFIMGLMSALVIVNMEGMTSRSTLSADARDLGNRLLMLKDIAVIQGREMGLEVDLDGQRYREVDSPSPNEVPDPEDRKEATFYGVWQTMRAGVVLDEFRFGRDDAGVGDQFTLSFSASGELWPSGFVAYLRHEDLDPEKGISVEVSGLTGLIAYHEGRIQAEEVREESDF